MLWLLCESRDSGLVDVVRALGFLVGSRGALSVAMVCTGVVSGLARILAVGGCVSCGLWLLLGLGTLGLGLLSSGEVGGAKMSETTLLLLRRVFSRGVVAGVKTLFETRGDCGVFDGGGGSCFLAVG